MVKNNPLIEFFSAIAIVLISVFFLIISLPFILFINFLDWWDDN